jgi:FMN phosphatase YigB (HAD superfamily)
MVIASSSKKEHIAAALERLGIRHYFLHIFTCSEVGIGKHNPKIFMEAAEFLGSTPEDIWVFEDGLYAMKTAKEAGFRVLGVYDEASGGDWEEIQQTAYLAMKDLSEFDIFWEAAAE